MPLLQQISVVCLSQLDCALDFLRLHAVREGDPHWIKPKLNCAIPLIDMHMGRLTTFFRVEEENESILS